jgi:glycosyltransferase involved in cell wall biosynthesis
MAANPLAERAARWEYHPDPGEVPWVNPVDFVVRPSLSLQPRLNVLIPSLALRHMSGGPNTALQFVARLAADGEPIRLISTDHGLDVGSDEEALWRHVSRLTGLVRHHPNLEIVDGSPRSGPVAIGEHDVFFATAFWTAQAVKAVLPLVRPQRFLYLIQDFEPGFFAASSQYALALETYSLDHFPIVNTQMLFDYLVANRIGRFVDPDFIANAVVFQPSVDRFHFYPDVRTRPRRRLLFYARPSAGLRNMFELGVAALRLAHQRGTFAAGEWDFLGMGERFHATALSGQAALHPADWLDFDGYAEQMRQSDLLLSLMLAPHPSYPPLEMAACGGLVVTNTYDVKTAKRLEELSPNIIAAEPTIEAIADALGEAIRRLADEEGRRAGASLALPDDWDEAALPLVPAIRQAIKEIRHGPSRLDRVRRSRPEGRYDAFRLERRRQRLNEYDSTPVPGLLTFITPVWNTDPDYLRLLAESVLTQDSGPTFEWVVLDNGSDDPDTLAQLDVIGRATGVRLLRSPVNVGIVSGMRRCLEAASGDYVVHLDHDDLLAPDAVRTVTAALETHGWPPLFYSDEDKLVVDAFVEPYFKPDWDPVLLANSCYVAHLCGVRRDVALALGAYDDPLTEASPDWDLFVRALLAGHQPLHVPEVLYSWRVHVGSTAGDVSAKSSVSTSHKAVLAKLIRGKGLEDRFDLVPNPRSPGALDWWIRRRRDVPVRPLRTVVLGRDVPIDAPLAALEGPARAAAEGEEFLELRWQAAAPVGEEWPWEVAGLFELFPDTAVVGGAVERDGRLVSAGTFFGFGRGADSPDAGRGAEDFGWMVTLTKQRSVSAVTAAHLVADPSFVLDAVALVPESATLANAGAWLGAHAARTGRRVVFTPHLRGVVTDDWDAQVVADDRGLFNRANADLIPDVRFLSRSVRLDVPGDLQPAGVQERHTHVAGLLAEPAPALPSYPEWLSRRIVERGPRFSIPDDPPSFAVITPVYAGTEVSLFDQLVAALAAQSLPWSQWIIAADGALGPALSRRLRDLASADDRVVVLPGSRRGILATMRACLEAASAEYVVPVDADDLVTADALAVLAATVVTQDRPALVYSDEDIVDAQGVRDPFLRPDWDPVLHASGSYIWHLIAVRRDLGMAADLYLDQGANWCHDWDTVDRLTAAGHVPVHVPEVLYHWRHHARSSTNTVEPTAGSQQSVKHVMERMIARTACPERYAVEAFPLDRGAREWSIVRRGESPRPTALVVMSDVGEPCSSFLLSVARTCREEFGTVRVVPSGGPSWAHAIRQQLDDLTESIVVVASDAIDLLHDGWNWEALKLMELHPDVAVVSGRLVDPAGRVVAGAEVSDPDGGRLLHPLRGLSITDPGPYAFALKPHRVSAVTTSLFVADRLALRVALDSGATDGVSLAAALEHAGRAVAYTPLLAGRISVPDGPMEASPAAGTVRGLAGFAWGREQFAD